jgi:hypothetical protein
MSGPVRWVLFCSIIVLAGAAIFALWGGLTPDLIRAVATFAIVMLAAVALFGVGRR